MIPISQNHIGSTHWNHTMQLLPFQSGRRYCNLTSFEIAWKHPFTLTLVPCHAAASQWIYKYLLYTYIPPILLCDNRKKNNAQQNCYYLKWVENMLSWLHDAVLHPKGSVATSRMWCLNSLSLYPSCASIALEFSDSSCNWVGFMTNIPWLTQSSSCWSICSESISSGMSLSAAVTTIEPDLLKGLWQSLLMAFWLHI